LQNTIKISDLNPKQRALLKSIVELFYEKFNGRSNIVVSERIVSLLQQEGHQVGDAKFRSLLGVIRRNRSCTKYLKKYYGIEQHAFVVSNNEGYWWTTDMDEMKEFWKSQHGRVCEIMMNSHELYEIMGFNSDQLRIFENNENAA
jgi:hypothetical protein